MEFDLHFILLIVLGIVSMVYLATLHRKPNILQYILKSCLMPLILAIYISDANQILLPIILAMVFAWAGDILLIKINNLLCFRLGLASFLFGHICYIIAMFKYAMPPNVFILIISIVIAAGLGFLIFKIVKPTNDMKIPVIIYEATILLMAIFASQLFINQGATFGLLVFIGSLFFVASDGSLAMVTFQKKPFYVFCMSTYITAQLLIALGFATLG